MEKVLQFDPTQGGKPFKILHATNGGPLGKRHAPDDQTRSNFSAYQAAGFPYSRNHDSNGIIGAYGGPFSHDITAVFPNFDADENDPASYDFACTDESILYTLEAGTRTFYRLGQTIEHQIKKHDTLPPKDFGKWARICEHIIRHYTEGWAGGFQLDMPYWEIWNEADMVPDGAPEARRLTWGGTKAQFFDFFATAALHLKACFPHLKIGGPALCCNMAWAEEFLATMRARGVALDFFSWHIYTTDVKCLIDKGAEVRALLDRYGYTDTESILNEWNYVRGWGDDFVPSLLTIHGMKGAAFTMATLCAAQPSPIDMLMYYDTRPGVFNGAFDYYSMAPLKGYYPFLWYNALYGMPQEIPCLGAEPDIYTLCGKDESGKMHTILAYYTEHEEGAPQKTVRLDFGTAKAGAHYDIYLLDEGHDGTCIGQTDTPVFTLAPNTCLFLREC